jgi:hypothetical protein
MMAVKPGLDFPDTLNIHDCGAMYPQELSRVELLFKAGEGLAEFVLASRWMTNQCRLNGFSE